MRVTISRLSRYSVSGCSPAIEVGTISPRSLNASTSVVAGRAASVSWGLAANVRHLDFGLPCRFFRSYFRIPIGTTLPYRGDLIADLVIRGATAHQRLQVVPGLREEAGEEGALGGEAHAVAGGAERLRHRRDDADLAAAVDIVPALGHF